MENGLGRLSSQDSVCVVREFLGLLIWRSQDVQNVAAWSEKPGGENNDLRCL
jgi:hypothetical protein